MSVTAAAIAAGAAIFGGLMKSRQARKTQQSLENETNQQQAKNEAYYNNNYYADATQLADNRKALTEANERYKRNNQAAAGTASVMGGTTASVAATKEANAKALADATGSVAANAQQQKLHIMDSYRNRDAAISTQRRQAEQARNDANAAAIDTAVSGVNTIAKSLIANNDKKDE